jgi:hypothetical protein
MKFPILYYRFKNISIRHPIMITAKGPQNNPLMARLSRPAIEVMVVKIMGLAPHNPAYLGCQSKEHEILKP